MIDGLIHIKFAKIDFPCPFCGHVHVDHDEKYLARINRNKIGYTYLLCHGCGVRFGLACDITGDLKSFKLNGELK